MQNRLTATIAGQEFLLVADEPEAYMREIAAVANEKVLEARRLVGNTTFSTGVLATLNMADEAVKLRHQCENSTAVMEAQEQELHRLREELETIRNTRPDEDPAALRTEIRKLEQELAAANHLHDSVCAETDAEMAILNDQVEELKALCEQTRAKIIDIKPFERKIETLKRDNEKLRSDLKQARAEKEAAIHEKQNSLQSEIDQLNQALEALHVKESENSVQSKKRIAELTCQVEELQTARVDPEPLYAEIKNLQSALDEKERQVSENSALKVERERLQAQIIQMNPAPLRAQIEHLQAELEAKEQQLNENVQMQAEIDALRQQMRDSDPTPLYEEIHQLQRTLGEHQSQEAENQRLRTEMEQLRAAYNDVRPAVEFTRLERELEQVRQELGKAKIQLAGREIGEIGEVRREITRLRALEETYNKMEKPEALHAEIDRLQAELRTVRETQAEPVAQANTDETEALRQEIKQLKAELNRQVQLNGNPSRKKKGGR